MSLISNLIDFFLHIDKNLALAISSYGFLVYPLLFLIIFLETGLVITPFLPGDSLLFAAGALASKGLLNIFLIFILVSIAAILGDSVNYWLGKYFSEKISKLRFFKKEYLERAKVFYEKHGGKTIIIARFIPIIRTFAPFVAGMGAMNYSKFITYNITGALLWIILFLSAGYLFGTIPLVENNFSLVILAIIILSLIPAIVEAVRSRKH